ncbi:hypothetical protein C7974DRAFT_143504 [Boeremia exigua]|uniref:uncharacterized protein n=1 Tax=Boeremia exigua TaxID=749465 RepID=UPI001E8D511B|nr:uncharacterized protein C7974DRAFT_143504 [Boeremia exigua]KAH6637554.1 hypothetical protein C7974DRAFT_143504 [Boeremia exigua]
MASSTKRRKIYVFATPAGTSFGTHGGGGHLPFPNFMKHWGVMIATSESDQDGLMVELNKGSAIKSFVKLRGFEAPIWPWVRYRTERDRQEYLEPPLKIKDTYLTTILTDQEIRDKATEACSAMGGTYHVKDFNCQTMVQFLIPRIQYEQDRWFDRTALDEVFTRDWLPTWLGGLGL